MTNVIPFVKPAPADDVISELFEEWHNHKKKLTFSNYIATRMPLFFGEFSSNLPIADKIKNTERHFAIPFEVYSPKNGTLWTGILYVDSQKFTMPQFVNEEDLRLFMILAFLKIRSIN